MSELDAGRHTTERGVVMIEGELAGEALQSEMDDLSLRQALVDFEVANARVLDLTRRLMETQAETVELRRELERLRGEYSELNSVHEAMKSSQAFRTASKIWALRNAIGR